MGKIFNINGICRPEYHYMVNIDDRLSQIESYIDNGEYFTINRARQYGKTTTLNLLEENLADKYTVFSISFEGLADESYRNHSSFCQTICGLLFDTLDFGEASGVPDSIKNMLEEYEQDRHTGMDVKNISNLIYVYTNGYPYLVSYICKKTDESAAYSRTPWSKESFLESVICLVKGPNSLYDDMIKHIQEFPDLYTMLNNILFVGEEYPYHIYDRVEMKIWHGQAYHHRGENQLVQYLDAYQLKKGYLLTFNFNKDKETGLKEILVGDKVILDVMV